MAPKQLNHKSEIFEVCMNGLAMVDYPIYNPNDDNKEALFSLGYDFKTGLLFFWAFSATW